MCTFFKYYCQPFFLLNRRFSLVLFLMTVDAARNNNNDLFNPSICSFNTPINGQPTTTNRGMVCSFDWLSLIGWIMLNKHIRMKQTTACHCNSEWSTPVVFPSKIFDLPIISNSHHSKITSLTLFGRCEPFAKNWWLWITSENTSKQSNMERRLSVNRIRPSLSLAASTV